MRGLAWLFVAGLLVAGHAQSATARDQLGRRDPVVVDQARGYLFFRASQATNLVLMREVSPPEAAAHEAEREAAYERAAARQQRRIAQWEDLRRNCRGFRERDEVCREPRPEPLVREAFIATYPGPEMDNFVEILGGREFTRDGPDRTYFMALEPGSYLIYGELFLLGNGAATGTCLCMGTIRFEARAGQIADLGRLSSPIIEAVAAGRPYNPGVSHLPALAVAPYEASMSRPDRLAGHPIAPAELRAADKVPNYYGALIGRIGALDGIIAYERDRVIDVRSGGPVDGRN